MAINSSFRTLSLDNAEGIVTSKNYLKSSFENGTIAGWSLFNTTLTNNLPSGTIAAGSVPLSLSITSTNPIEGSNSLQLSASSSVSAGQGIISDVFTLSNGDLGKVLNSKFSYNVVSGASNLNFSGVIGSQTLAVAFYDVTAATWIGAPSGGFGLTQSTGFADSGPITMQSSVVAGQQYQMAIYFSVACVGTTTITFDNFICSRTVITTGAAMTDWVKYTPATAGLGTPSLTSVWSRRVGDTLEIRGLITPGTPTGVNTQIGLGYNGVAGNVVTDVTKTDGTIVGSLEIAASNSTYFNWTLLAAAGQSYVNVGFQSSTTSGVTAAVGTAFGITAGTQIQFYGRVPIVGWSSNVQQSSDSDQRVIAAILAQTSAQSLALGDNKLTGFTINQDTAGGWDAVNNWYRAGSTGFYDFGIIALFLANTTAVLSYRISGGAWSYGSGPSSTNRTATHFLAYLQAGQILEFGVNLSGTATSTVGGSTSIYLARRSGSAVVQNTESVNASYAVTGSPAVAAGGIIKYDSRLKDTHAAYNTTSGVYTVPVGGEYRLSITATFASVSSAFIYKNGVGFGYLATSPSNGFVFSASRGIPLLAGDTISIGMDAAASLSTPTTLGVFNTFSIERVGN